MLTGRNPFTESKTPADYIRQVIHGRHLPLSELHPEFPGELAALTDQLLQKSAVMRPGSAEEVKKRLENILATISSADSATLELDRIVLKVSAVPEKHTANVVSQLPDSTPVFRWCAPLRQLICLLLLAFLMLFSWSYYRQKNTLPLVVAVPEPTVERPFNVFAENLLRSTVQQALEENLQRLFDKKIVTFDAGRRIYGSPEAIVKNLRVDEVIQSHLDCTEISCLLALRRHDAERLIEIADIHIPLDSYRGVHDSISATMISLYPEYRTTE